LEEEFDRDVLDEVVPRVDLSCWDLGDSGTESDIVVLCSTVYALSGIGIK